MAEGDSLGGARQTKANLSQSFQNRVFGKHAGMIAVGSDDVLLSEGEQRSDPSLAQDDDTAGRADQQQPNAKIERQKPKAKKQKKQFAHPKGGRYKGNTSCRNKQSRCKRDGLSLIHVSGFGSLVRDFRSQLNIGMIANTMICGNACDLRHGRAALARPALP